MLHIFLTILKIPLILLALVLLILLAAVLLLLFVPVRYQARLAKGDDLTLSARVHWLFHLLSVRADFYEKNLHFSVKLLGFSLVGEKKERGAPKPAKEPDSAEAGQAAPAEAAQAVQAEPAEAEQAVPAEVEQAAPAETEATAPAHAEPAEPAQAEPGQPEPAGRRPRVPIQRRILGFRDKIRNTCRRIQEKIRNIRDTVQNAKAKLDSFLELWYDEPTQMTIAHGKSEIFYILKHYLPGKTEGRLLFGLSDPAATGQALGALCVLQAFTGNHLQIEADFERPVLEGDIFLKGHVRLCHLVKSGLSLLLDRYFRVTLGRVRKFRSGS